MGSATATNGAASGRTPKPVSTKSSDLEVVNAAGEKLPVWPCPLCTLVGRTESARSHPLQRCYANPQNPECKPPIAKIRACDILQIGHPLLACMSRVEIPAEYKAKAAANDTSTQKQVTYAQVSEGADALEQYLKCGELGVEDCFKAAIESLGVEVTPP